MIRSLKVQNFKAIGPAPCEIELRPLTVLVGENGAGKSSLLQALALLAQSAVEDTSRMDLVISGSKVDLVLDTELQGTNDRDPLYYSGHDFQPLSVGIEIEDSDRIDWQFFGLPETPPDGWTVAREPWPPIRIGYSFARRRGHWLDWEHEVTFQRERVFRAWSKSQPDARRKREIERGVELAGVSYPNWFVHPDGVLRPTLFSRERNGGASTVSSEHLGILDGVWQILLRALDRVHYLTEVRGWPLMDTRVGPDVRFAGKHGEMTVRLLSNIAAKTKPGFSVFRRWAERFGFKDLECGWSGGNRLAVTFVDPLSLFRLDLGSAASGSSQALILATQLLLTESDSTLLIEEPENNLHPAFERLVAEMLVDSIRSRHQVVLATHSEILVAALGNAVRHRLLSPEDLAIWHLTRNEKGIEAEQIHVSDRGYLERWVPSFAAVEEGIANEWYQKLPETGEENRGGHAHPRRAREGAKRRPRR